MPNAVEFAAFDLAVDDDAVYWTVRGTFVNSAALVRAYK
jgi:hypothetical protein